MSENNTNEMMGKTQVISGIKLVVGQTELAKMVTEDTVTILYYGNIVTINGEKASTKFPKDKYTDYVNRYIKKQIRIQKKKEEIQEKEAEIKNSSKAEHKVSASKAAAKQSGSDYYIDTETDEADTEEEDMRHYTETDDYYEDEDRYEEDDDSESEEYEDDESDDEDDEEDDDEESSDRSYKAGFIAALIAALVFFGTSVFLVLTSMNIIPVSLPWAVSDDNSEGNEIKVIRLAEDVAVGEQIENSDLEEVAVTQGKYDELSSGKMLDETGTEVSDPAILYSNLDDVTGKYASENLKKGEYITLSDFSDIMSGEKTITMDVDGEQVTVPVTVTQTGNSSITIYAICTNTTEDGTVKNTAMKLGEFSLEGRNLMDIKNENGESVIEQLLKEQTENQKKAEEEAAKKAEEAEKEETAESTASPESTSSPESTTDTEK